MNAEIESRPCRAPGFFSPVGLHRVHRRRTARLASILLIAASLASVGARAEDSSARVPARFGDDAFEEEFEKGEMLLRNGQYEEALKAYKKANGMRNKKCAECLWGMARAYDGLGAYRNVIESAERVLEYASDDTLLRARAHNLKAVALIALSEGKDEKKLKAAEAELRQALQLKADLSIVRFNLGVVLLKQNRDAEGIAELRAYLKAEDRGRTAEEARKMIENPRRGREAFAPEFSLTSVQGEYISLEDLQGKIVLLDFWGTWCPPCVDSVPSLRQINKKFAGELFVMIAVSSDSDEEKWREFIAKNKMNWPQYLDRDSKIQRTFRVDVFPTYVLIDQEGVVRYRSTGGSWMKNAFLEEHIRKLLKSLAKRSG